jgi:hypothetical protein
MRDLPEVELNPVPRILRLREKSYSHPSIIAKFRFSAHNYKIGQGGTSNCKKWVNLALWVVCIF